MVHPGIVWVLLEFRYLGRIDARPEIAPADFGFEGSMESL